MTPALPPLRTLSAAALIATLAACATGPKPDAIAVAELQATRGNGVTGTVHFAQFGNKVRVSGQIRGLKPGAEHGFHVHEKGDCSSGDGMGTGGHFNPVGAPHGRHGQGQHHVGDLPPLGADSYGVARIDFETDRINLNGARSVAGKGLIVHRDPDDYKTQPTGNAGPRVACAVIALR